MHLISEIPDPAAYGAKDLTRLAEVKAKSVCRVFSDRLGSNLDGSYREDEVEEIVDGPYRAPSVPFITSYHHEPSP